MFGWTGTILRVDLTRARVWRDATSSDLLHAYLGGRGLGMRLLRGRHRLGALHPEMPLVFAVGPLCGTGAPMTARLAVVSRSPLTGTVADGSVGGGVAQGIKAVGLDAVCITGQAPRPMVLAIAGESAQLLPADELWGRSTAESAVALGERGSAIAIGPAGENQALMANLVTSEGRGFGRGGLGAVMGYKRLKAVVVAGGQGVGGGQAASVAQPQRFARACEDIARLLRASPVLFGQLGLRELGSAALVDLVQHRRMLPTENFRQTVFAGAGAFSGHALGLAHGEGSTGCPDCPIRCSRLGAKGERQPEYDAAAHLGALNSISDREVIVRANALCTALGLDPISAAATLSAWGEARGRFVAAHDLERMLVDMAHRRGEGEQLALGSRRFAESLGRPELSMSVKGLELPAYDPRGSLGTALAYCTSSKGGCVDRAYPIAHEILRKPVATDRFTLSGKARIIKVTEDSRAAADSLMICGWATLATGLEELAELLSAATGEEQTAQGLAAIGERICLTERFYNCENGFSAADDCLPARFLSEEGSSGDGVTIAPVDSARLKQELQKYYRIRGLDSAGRLTDETFLERQP